MSAREESDESKEAFSRRLAEACDDVPDCPGRAVKGRQKWLRDALAQRDIRLSAEAVSCWFQSRSLPRNEYRRAVAEIVHVDLEWLFHGPDERKPASAPVVPSTAFPPKENAAIAHPPAEAIADIPVGRPDLFAGAVDLMSAMAHMSGARVAFSGGRETGAMFALLSGRPYAIQVLLADKVEPNRQAITVTADALAATAIIAGVPGDDPTHARFVLIEGEFRAGGLGEPIIVERHPNHFTGPLGIMREISSLADIP